MIKERDKGIVHFHILGALLAIAILYLLAVTFAKPTAYRPGEAGRQVPVVDYYSVKTSAGRPYQLRVEDLHLNDLESVLHSAVDIQVKLLHVKAETVKMAWNGLDEKTQSEVMAAFVRDIQIQQDQVNKFLDLYKSSKWILLKSDERKGKIEELLKSISGQQNDLLIFFKKIQEARSGGSISEE